MPNPLPLPLAVLLFAMPAFAAPALVAPPMPLVGGRNFISPMGEPFHGEDGLSGAEHWFAAADADHDGRLTRAEFEADSQRFFAIVDGNRDGVIDPAEIDHYETDIAPEIRVDSTGISPPPSSGDDSSEPTQTPYPDRLGAGRYGYLDTPEPIVTADANFDRGVSRAEFARAAARRFALLDANGDGAITRDELPRLSTAGPDSGGKPHRRRGR